MAREEDWDSSHLALHAPLQVPGPRFPEASAPTGQPSPFSCSWPIFPSTAQPLFFNTPDSSFPLQSTPEYDKKMLEWQPTPSTAPPPVDWQPITPAEGPSTTTSQGSPEDPGWEAPTGLIRPQPQKGEPQIDVEADSEEGTPRESSSPAIDVLTNSAFSSVLETKETDLPPLVRPQPLMAASSLADSSAMESLETEAAGPSSTDPATSSPPAPIGASFCRPPGLGPPTTTPSSSSTTHVCPICGFSCASKFHYNSHMNTHGDHQCSMCDYTSRTEGRLKKHMRESHTLEEQMAAGLELSPPSASAPAPSTPSTAPLPPPFGVIVSPSKPRPEEADESMEAPSSLDSSLGEIPPSPQPLTLQSALLGMIATSSASTPLDQMRAISEKSLMGEGTGGLLLMGSPLLGFPSTLTTPKKEGGERRGKVKQYKCKQCPVVSITKEDQWEHARTHIPLDKQLNCTLCNFVTEYKHHLEYHHRNHVGSKPFQCKKCSYTCVNKSMLNSHMKSHTNVYQFRCADCTYATKYCHSLKLHLKKYQHRRKLEGLELGGSLDMGTGSGMATPEGGSPLAVRKDSSASIASSLSGPFTPFNMLKKEEPFSPFGLFKREEPPVSAASLHSTPLSTFSLPNFPPLPTSQSLPYQLLLRQHQNQMEQMMGMAPVLKCHLCDFSSRSQDELRQHNISHMSQLLSGGSFYGLSLPSTIVRERTADDDDTTTGSPPGDDAHSHSNGSTGSPGSGRHSGDEEGGGRRKSKASRIDEIGQRLRDKASPDVPLVVKQEAMEVDEAQATATIICHEEEAVPLPPSSPAPIAAPTPIMGGVLQSSYLAHLLAQARANQVQQLQPSDGQWRFECPHCRMGFQDEALHQIHMGYHGYENVFQCNRCGHSTGSALAFNLHLLQSPHM